jgi:hypothetical protein
MDPDASKEKYPAQIEVIVPPHITEEIEEQIKLLTDMQKEINTVTMYLRNCMNSCISEADLLMLIPNSLYHTIQISPYIGYEERTSNTCNQYIRENKIDEEIIQLIKKRILRNSLL